MPIKTNYTFLLFCLIISSCNNDSPKILKGISVTQIKEKTFSTDEIIFERVNTNENEKYLQLADTNLILLFEKLIRENLVNDYYNHEWQYSIALFDRDTNYKNYFVIISDTSNAIIVFDSRSQYYSKIADQDWKSFLKKATKVFSKDIKMSDLENARKILIYCNETSLAVILNNDHPNEWPYFNGYFEYNFSRWDKAITEKEILNSIQEKFPENNYKITLRNWSTRCADNH